MRLLLAGHGRARLLELDAALLALTAAGAVSAETARCATEVVRRASASAHDAIVLHHSSSFDAVSAVCALRGANVWAPVVVLVPGREAADRVAALDAGADECMPEPVEPVELMARLHALLRRGRRARPAVLTVGGLRLDPATRSVWCHGTAVDLTKREFALLEALMRRPDQTLSPAFLVDRVWGQREAGNGDNLRAYIAHLRRKLRDPKGRELLETVRNVGYRLRTLPP